MKFKALILLGLCANCMAVQTAFEGSGAETDDVEVESDVLLYSKVADGSGDDLPDQSNVKCAVPLELDCWCVYADGTEVPGTKAYSAPMDCSRYRNMLPPARLPSRTTQSTVPSRTKAAQPQNVVEESDEEPVDDITYEEEQPVKSRPPVRDDDDENNINYNMPVKPESDEKKKPADLSNKIPTNADVVKPEGIDESKEEQDNHISGTNLKAAASKDRSSVKKVKDMPHPGIMAALIGGGVVILLCAILIILFIIYRVRKKDEGSYPLGDEKPIKNYAYSKAPSREFFA